MQRPLEKKPNFNDSDEEEPEIINKYMELTQDNTTTEEPQKRSRRRTKNDVGERKYHCASCEKTYLSYPALYTHMRSKHGVTGTNGKGRGRPKKDSITLDKERKKFNPYDNTFFFKSERTGKVEDYEKCIINAFESIYGSPEDDRDKLNSIRIRNTRRGMKMYNNVYEHPFLKKLLEDPHDASINLEDQEEICDNVLVNYLNKVSLIVNDEYFTTVISFVTLFREHVNIEFKARKECLEGDYTAKNSCESFPDSCNEFIVDFLNCGKKSDFPFGKAEAIDLTMHLSTWMFNNHYTCSKVDYVYSY